MYESLQVIWRGVVALGWWWLLVWFVVACFVAAGWSWLRGTGRYDGPGLPDTTALRVENARRRERLARLADDPGSGGAGVGSREATFLSFGSEPDTEEIYMGEPRGSRQRQEDEDKGKNDGKTYGELKHEQNKYDQKYGSKRK